MGRTVGSLVGSVFKGLSEQVYFNAVRLENIRVTQLAETQRQTRDVYEEAKDRVQNSGQIRSVCVCLRVCPSADSCQAVWEV